MPVVIVSFGDRATEALFHGEAGTAVRKLPKDIHRVAQRKLDLLNAATALLDLRAPPGNRLELLRGSLKGRHSIRINDQWRIVFRWTPSGPEEVRITDYH
jgi:proteic killer suppression protein